MNIQTAAGYMKHGYRIRRSGWNDPEQWLSMLTWEDGEPFPIYFVPIYFDELLADDWEIITDGVISDFPLVYSDD